MCAMLITREMTIIQYGGFVDGVILTISCLEGYSLPEGKVEFVCGSDGSWSPDPSDYQCAPQVQNQGLCTAVHRIHSSAIVLSKT